MQPNVSEDINKIMPSITFRVLNKMKLLNDVQADILLRVHWIRHWNGCEEGFIYLFLQGLFL